MLRSFDAFFSFSYKMRCALAFIVLALHDFLKRTISRQRASMRIFALHALGSFDQHTTKDVASNCSEKKCWGSSVGLFENASTSGAQGLSAGGA